MINARYRDWVFLALMTLFMSLTVSGALVLFNEHEASFLRAWTKEFVRAYIAVVPSAIAGAPLMRRLTSMIVARESGLGEPSGADRGR